MRVLGISIDHFACIRSASVKFGAWLNVLYGPNDLGKSTLAEAMRAAFLLPCTSSEHKRFVPAGTDEVPKVSLTFETEGGAKWRVTKAFGVRGTATLESSKDGIKWHAEARGREVDGSLRTLLAWGIPPPGGKGAPHGMGSAFLTTALLGRQGEVDGVLAASLEEDRDPAGRGLVTRALNVLGQDPLVQRMLARLEEKTDKVFTPEGKQRRTADSPLVRVKQEIDACEKKLRELDEAARRSDEVQRSIREFMGERDRIAEEREAGAKQVEKAQKDAALEEQRSAARKLVETAQGKLELIDASARSIAEARSLVTESETALTTATEAVRLSDEAAVADEAELRAAEQGLLHARAEGKEARSVADQVRERRLAELRAELASAQSRAEAAREVQRREERAGFLLQELRDAEAVVEEKRREEGRAALLLDQAILQENLHAARASQQLARDAETTAAVRRGALEAATLALRDAEMAVDAARRTIEATAAEASRRQATVAQEDARRQALRTSLLQLEALEREALALAERAQAAIRRAERVSSLQQSLDAATERAAATDRQLLQITVTVEQTERDHREVIGVAASRRLDELSRRDGGRAIVANPTELRSRASEMLARANELVAPFTPLPSADRLAAALAIAARRESLGIPPRRDRWGFPWIVSISIGLGIGVVVALCLSVAGYRPVPVVVVALLAALAAVGLCAVAFRVSSTGSRQGSSGLEQADREYIRRRWDEDVEPLLRRAGVPDLPALARRCQEADACRRESTGLREQAEQLESQAREMERDTESFSSLRREEQSLRNQLSGLDPSSLASRASSMAGIGKESFEQQISEAEQAMRAALRSREQANEHASRLASQRESAKALLEAAVADRDLHAGSLRLEPRAALDEAQHRLQSARTQAQALREQLESVGSSTAAPPASIEAPAAIVKTVLASATTALKAKATEHELALRMLAEAETRREVIARDAASSDLDALTERFDANARSLGLAAADVSDVATARAHLEQRQQATAHAAATEIASRGRHEESRLLFERAAAALAMPWNAVFAQAEENAARLRREIDAGGAAPSQHGGVDDTVVRESEATALAAREGLAKARSALAQATAERDTRRTERDRALGQLEEREKLAADFDRPAAEADLDRARCALSELAESSPVAPEAIVAAQRALAGCEKRLRHVEDDLKEARGRLAVVGGSLAHERLQEEREALDRLRESEVELELEYSSTRLLQQVLKEADAARATHLGASLGSPVTERFIELTGGRYAQVSLDPALKTRTVAAGSDQRIPAALSVGTREQLATILRLALAGQLRTVLLLDDQLVQSDLTRLEWFRQALRMSARERDHQLLVITCRCDDYLSGDEIPAADAAHRESADGHVRAINLEKLIHRIEVR